MSTVPARKHAPSGGPDEASWHGAHPGESAPGACRRMAGEVGAEDWGVFAVAAGAQRRLEPRLTGANAGAFLESLLGRFDSDMARHALASSTPFWWGRDPWAPGNGGALPWAARGSFEGLARSGVGFPCAGPRGACGAVLFWGEGIALDAARCLAVHARLFALFEALAAARPKHALPPLSKRELECLALTAKGLTSEEIADALKFSAHTANQHLAAAAAKLDAVNRMQAVAKALRLGLID